MCTVVKVCVGDSDGSGERLSAQCAHAHAHTHTAGQTPRIEAANEPMLAPAANPELTHVHGGDSLSGRSL